MKWDKTTTRCHFPICMLWFSSRDENPLDPKTQKYWPWTQLLDLATLYAAIGQSLHESYAKEWGNHSFCYAFYCSIHFDIWSIVKGIQYKLGWIFFMKPLFCNVLCAFSTMANCWISCARFWLFLEKFWYRNCLVIEFKILFLD